MNNQESDNAALARKPAIKVSIGVYGLIRSPQEIAALLGLAPTRTWVKGERIQESLLFHKSNRWILDGPSDPSRPFIDQVEALLDQVTPLAGKFSELPDDLEVLVYCVVYDYDRKTDLSLSRTAIRTAARIGAQISIVYYDMTNYED